MLSGKLYNRLRKKQRMLIIQRSVATGADVGVYLEHYLKLSLNWKTFDERTFDYCQGITLHHLPGHTDGLIGMQINMRDTGLSKMTVSTHFLTTNTRHFPLHLGPLPRHRKRKSDVFRTTRRAVLTKNNSGETEFHKV